MVVNFLKMSWKDKNLFKNIMKLFLMHQWVNLPIGWLKAYWINLCQDLLTSLKKQKVLEPSIIKHILEIFLIIENNGSNFGNKKILILWSALVLAVMLIFINYREELVLQLLLPLSGMFLMFLLEQCLSLFLRKHNSNMNLLTMMLWPNNWEQIWLEERTYQWEFKLQDFLLRMKRCSDLWTC